MGLQPGSYFAGYRIESEVARGGMGIVYRATDVGLERDVALKVIRSDFADDDDYRVRFKRESRIAASVDHPNVVAIFEAREQDGTPYLVMPYIDGRSLATVISEDGRLEPGVAVEIIRQAGRGLDAVHAAGLIHRDVKPANILIRSLTEEIRALITDFGIARSSAANTELTSTGAFLGTLDYASPEQLRGEEVDARSDVYALGCVLFEAISGRVPFPQEDGSAKMFAHVHGDLPLVDAALGARAKAIEPVIHRAMAKSPGDRYRSAGALGAAAAAAISAGAPPTVADSSVAAVASPPPPPPAPPRPGPPVQAPPAPPPRQTAETAVQSPPRRRSVRIAAVALAAMAAVGLAGAAILLAAGSDDDRSGGEQDAAGGVSEVSSPVQAASTVTETEAEGGVQQVSTVTVSTTSTTDSDPRIPASGTYNGQATQSSPDSSLAKSYPVSMSFSSSGSTVDYPSLDCAGTLIPGGFNGRARVYQEQITDGHCDSGGTWEVVVEGPDRLTADWSLDSANYTVAATLAR